MGTTSSLWTVQAASKRMELAATPDAVGAAGAVLARIAARVGLAPEEGRRLVAALCEIVLNACTYAYGARRGTIVVRIDCRRGVLRMQVADSGRGFDCRAYFDADGSPTSRCSPDSGLLAAARAVDRMYVQSGDDGTRVTMVKRLHQ